MEVLVAVIDDLWRFAYSRLFGSVVATKEYKEKEVQGSLPFTVGASKIQAELFSRTGKLKVGSDSVNVDLRPGEQYFVGEVDAYLYSDPVIAFDTALVTVPYGQSVLLKKVGGRWAEVETTKGQSGWMLKDVLALKQEDVRPHLLPDIFYDAHHPDTIKLRACIGDEFGGARADLPLSSAEYVTYQLSLRQMQVEWDIDSPRVAGSWQYKLRGEKGVYMNVLPKTHSVMEYSVGEVGHLAFVEAVFPDRSIKISEVGSPEEGCYREAILTQEEYRELGPVFISVT